ncbi:hypothetical protein LINPERHAP2_LOCUS26023 [Linum perenne]
MLLLGISPLAQSWLPSILVSICSLYRSRSQFILLRNLSLYRTPIQLRCPVSTTDPFSIRPSFLLIRSPNLSRYPYSLYPPPTRSSPPPPPAKHPNRIPY